MKLQSLPSSLKTSTWITALKRHDEAQTRASYSILVYHSLILVSSLTNPNCTNASYAKFFFSCSMIASTLAALALLGSNL